MCGFRRFSMVQEIQLVTSENENKHLLWWENTNGENERASHRNT